MSRSTFARAVELDAEGRSFAVATVVAVRRPTSARPGASGIVHPDGTIEPLAIGLPGDREVDMKRLEAQVAPAEPEPFDEADFAKHPSLVKGYIGPGILGSKNGSGIRYLVDPRVVDGTAWITGAVHPIDGGASATRR